MLNLLYYHFRTMNNHIIINKNRSYLSNYILGHNDSLYSYALRLTRNADEARDLLHETVCRSLNNAHKYNEKNSAGAWLFTIMHNIFINEIKSRHRTNTSYCDVDCIDAVDDSGGEELQYALDELNMAIQHLNDHDRAIITMRMRGAAYKEIASELNINEGTVKSSINRIKKQLRKMLNHLL